MQQLAIICEERVDGQKIVEALSADHVNVALYDNAITLVGAINDGAVNGLIFGIVRFSDKKIKIIDLIKESFPNLPVVLSIEQLNNQARQVANSYDHFTVVKYPEESKNLGGIFTKMLEQQRVYSRKYVRYDTQLDVTLTIYGSEFSGLMTNLSAGGAQVLINNTSIEKGETVLLYVPLFNDLKKHSMAAKVVWLKKQKGQILIGLEFSSPSLDFFDS